MQQNLFLALFYFILFYFFIKRTFFFGALDRGSAPDAEYTVEQQGQTMFELLREKFVSPEHHVYEKNVDSDKKS